MPKIICISTGLTGILNASFELVSRLQKEGNQCIIATPMQVGDYVNAQGFEYIQLAPIAFDPAPDAPAFSGVLGKLRRIIFKYSKIKERRKQALGALGMEDFKERITSQNPDLIFIDVELHEHIMTLVTAGFNVKLLSQWFSLWKRRGLPPLVTDIIPGKGFSGTGIGIWLAWKRIEVQRWWVFIKKKLVSGFTDRRTILQRYAEQVGFDKKYIPDNYWPGPFTYDKLPVVAMVSEQLEFPHEKRPNLEYLGPMVFEERKETSCSDTVISEIDALIEHTKKSGKKLIYCSVSTFKAGDHLLISKVLEAVSKEPTWLLIVGLGGKGAEFSNLTLSDNVHVFDFVPQLKILKHADLSINHGGIHTINECLHFGVPMLVYSGKRSDQNGCAARVQYHGLGLMGDKDKESKNEIKRKIDQLLRKNVI